MRHQTTSMTTTFRLPTVITGLLALGTLSACSGSESGELPKRTVIQQVSAPKAENGSVTKPDNSASDTLNQVFNSPNTSTSQSSTAQATTTPSPSPATGQTARVGRPSGVMNDGTIEILSLMTVGTLVKQFTQMMAPPPPKKCTSSNGKGAGLESETDKILSAAKDSLPKPEAEKPKNTGDGPKDLPTSDATKSKQGTDQQPTPPLSPSQQG